MEKFIVTCPSQQAVQDYFFPERALLQKIWRFLTRQKDESWVNPRLLKFLKQNLSVFKEGLQETVVIDVNHHFIPKDSQKFDYNDLLRGVKDNGLKPCPLWVPFAMRMQYKNKDTGEKSQIIFVTDLIALEPDEYYAITTGNHYKKGPGIGIYLLADQKVRADLVQALKLPLQWKNVYNFFQWAWCM